MVSDERESTRERILSAVLELLDEGGTDAVTTRAVVARAGAQAPAIYRLFGDMRGLLAAAAERGFADWVERKGTRAPAADPVDDLREGWNDAVQFGLHHPALYRIVNADPTPSPSITEGQDLLRAKIDRAARAGRLRVSQEHAVGVLRATALGVTLTLLDTPEEERDPDIAPIAREAAIAAITASDVPAAPMTAATAAVTLSAHLDDSGTLSPAERLLLGEWLDRLAQSRTH
jgi:AcrR family transcriptional regulator